MKNIINRKTGFTLMEITVVIIVVAVLASVATPLVGSIIDQGRASGTKQKMNNLKSALIKYKNDVGRYPSVSIDVTDSKSFDQAKVLNIEDISDNIYNVLVSDYNGEVNVNKYDTKWKGPYMDSDPGDFMIDSWGNPFWYIRFNKSLYLWSAGPDGEFYVDSKGLNVDYVYSRQGNDDCDDIVMAVARFKKAAPIENTEIIEPPTMESHNLTDIKEKSEEYEKTKKELNANLKKPTIEDKKSKS